MSELMFKTSFNGFNREEVLNYIKGAKEQAEKDMTENKSRITELEDMVTKQVEQINRKNDEIEGLYIQLERAQKKAGGKLGELSALVDELDENEKSLRRQFECKEAEYKNKILILEKSIESDEKKYADDIAELKEQSSRDMDKLTENLKREHEAVIENLKRNYDAEISRLKKEYTRELENVKLFHAGDIQRLQQEHEEEIKKELEKAELNNKKAMEFARAEVSEIKSSIDSARAIEEDARLRAAKIMTDTRAECDEMKIRSERELADRKKEALALIEQELNLKKSEINDAYKKLQEIIDVVDSNKDKFVIECDRMKQSLQGLL